MVIFFLLSMGRSGDQRKPSIGILATFDAFTYLHRRVKCGFDKGTLQLQDTDPHSDFAGSDIYLFFRTPIHSYPLPLLPTVSQRNVLPFLFTLHITGGPANSRAS